MNTTTSSVGPARNPAGPLEPKQAVFACMAELRAVVQQAQNMGVAVPFAAEIDRLREPLVSTLFVAWVRAQTEEAAARLAGAIGTVDAPRTALFAIGDRSNSREVLRDAFEWLEQKKPAGLILYCTVGNVPAEVEAWLAHDANVVLYEGGAPQFTAAASVAKLDPPHEILGTLLDSTHPARELLQIRSRLWQIVLFAHAMENLASDHQRRLKSRRLRDELKMRELDRDSLSDPARRAVDAYRLKLEADVATLQRELVEYGKVAFATDGTLLGSIRSSVDAVGEPDLVMTPGPDVERVRLNDRTHVNLVDALKQHLRAALKRDWTQLEVCHARIEFELQQQLGPTGTLEQITEQEWLRGFPPLLLENSYTGEVPRTGFMQSLSRGRQIVMATMGILGLLSLVARTNWRSQYWIVLLLIPLFAGAAIYASRKAKAERAHRLQKELEKLRETLLRDMKRLVGEMQRERQARIQLVSDQLKRGAQTRMDTQFRSTSQARAEQLQRTRGELRDRSRVTETKLRDAGTLSASIARARLTASQALADADRRMRTARDAPYAAKTTT